MNARSRTGAVSTLAAVATAFLALPAAAVAIPATLPDPDGKPADMTKPVQVYILMGQSNMLTFGDVGRLTSAVKTKGKYPYLVDDAGNWTVRKDVRNVRVAGSGMGRTRMCINEWMTIRGNMGPEMGIGHWVGHVTDAPVLILKSCTGNRSLGWDLLPPGSERYEYVEGGKTWIYAGYKDSPERWIKGTKPRRIGWYAGVQYDGDIRRAKEVLADLGKYYPGATRYEVAGFCYWQGDKDRYNAGHATRYEKNLVHLIKTLRKEFNAPNANFVCATLGQTRKGAGGNEGHILRAQLAVDGKTGKYPEFKGNVATFYSNPVSKGGASSGHYGGNPETYMNVGEGMGRAMAELILSDAARKTAKKAKKKAAAPKRPSRPAFDASAAKAERIFEMARNAERMGQKSVARTFYKRVVDKYPGTPAAKKAAERLERLK
ncbi:MAG: sialate O-acetylesterase [Planctomycetota bacterium]|jgi:hypothetical protein